MICNGCNNQEATRIRSHWTGTKWSDVCDKCGGVQVKLYDDVSPVHEPYFDEHLCDKEHPKGRWISSRAEKADVLDRLGIREKRESTIPYIKDVKQRQKYFREKFG